MGIYTFTLEKFHIDNTRSRDDDTDTVQFGARAGKRSFGTRSHYAGDVDNGDHGVGLTIGPVVLADAATPAVIAYTIFNGDTGKLGEGLGAVTERVAGRAMDGMLSAAQHSVDPTAEISIPSVGPEGGPEFSDSTWINLLQFLTIANFLFPDCDGFVVAGGVGKNKVGWDRAIDASGGTTYRQTIRYPGDDSPAGCGSNSDYTVTWAVTRRRASGPSLRTFLREQGLTLAPGLRSLAPGDRISVRQLMN